MTEAPSPHELAQITACGSRMEDPSLYPSAFYEGQKIYFCHAGCLEAFKQNPQAFLAGDMEHPEPDTP